MTAHTVFSHMMLDLLHPGAIHRMWAVGMRVLVLH